MTTQAAMLRPALAALDLALADNAPGGKGQLPALHEADDACRVLYENTFALAQAVRAASDAASSTTDLPALASTLYRCAADAVAGYHALADASHREPANISWERLFEFARDTLVSLAHILAGLIDHALHGHGRLTQDFNMTLPGDMSDLQRLRPLSLAYERHRVQAALRDAQRAEDEAPRAAQTQRDERAADERVAREFAKSIFWSQVAAAGLAVWLFS